MRTFTATNIPDVILIKPQAFYDHRGGFIKAYRHDEYKINSVSIPLAEENHILSSKWVLRWLHFQTRNPQAKLVRIIRGSAIDIAVDIRKESSTHGKYSLVFLSSENRQQLFIPRWFAHGFLSLEDGTEVLYKCDELYDPLSDGGITWNDPDLGIPWERLFRENNISAPILSEKDKALPTLKEFFWIIPFNTSHVEPNSHYSRCTEAYT